MGFEGWKMIIPIIVAGIVMVVVHLIVHPRDAEHAVRETGGKNEKD